MNIKAMLQRDAALSIALLAVFWGAAVHAEGPAKGTLLAAALLHLYGLPLAIDTLLRLRKRRGPQTERIGKAAGCATIYVALYAALAVAFDWALLFPTAVGVLIWIAIRVDVRLALRRR